MKKAIAIVRKIELQAHAEMMKSKPGSARARRFAGMATVAEMIRLALKHPSIVPGLLKTMKGHR